MSVRTILAAIILAAAPGFALGQGCDHADQVTMSCAEGTIWDSESRSCVPQISS